jgi:hypothetical protein
LGEDLAHLEAGLEGTEPAQGNREYRGRVWCRDRERIGRREVPSIYKHAHRDFINPLKYWD